MRDSGTEPVRRRCGVASLTLATAWLVAIPAAPARGSEARCAGAVVEEVAAGAGGASVGLAPGDVLVRWEQTLARRREQGSFCQWWELVDLEVERATHGPVRVEIDRGGERHTVELPADRWRVEARPFVDEAARAALAAARAAPKDAALASAALATIDALEGFTAPAGGGARDPESPRALWLGQERARLLVRARRLDEAVAAARQLAAPAERAGVVQPIESPALDLYFAGRYAEAEELHRHARAVVEGRGRPGLRSAWLDLRIALSRNRLGRLDEGERELRRALALTRALAPGSYLERDALNNLATTVGRRGDLAAAEESLVAAQEIHARLHPENPRFPPALNNLGIVARRRGDLEGARRLFETALEFHRQSGTRSQESEVLNGLGSVAGDLGDWAASRHYFEQALALALTDGETQAAATIRLNLGNVALRAGELDAARRDLDEATRIQERVAAGTLEHAALLVAQAELAARLGDDAEAERLLRRALEIRRRLAPGRWAETEARHQLGRLALRRGDFAAAAAELGAATRLLDEALESVGGDALGAAAFRAKIRPAYLAEIEALLALGRVEEAFAASERSRARAFRELVEQRLLIFSDAVDRTLEAERRALLESLDRSYRALASAADETAVDQHRREIEETRARHRALVSRARAAATRTGALHPDVAAASTDLAAALGPGSVLLAFLVREEATELFVLAPGAPLAWHRVPLGESELTDRVAAARAELERPAGPRGRRAREQALGGLATPLLGPAARALGAATRVLVVADGALHLLPFAALPLPDQPERLLLEQAAVTILPAAAALLDPPGEPSPRPLLVAADPTLATGLGADHRAGLGPLPFAAEEARVIAALYPGAEVLTGAAASEERVKQRSGSAGILHFATHAEPDERFPLDSTVHLVGGELEDGRLRAWEVIEQLPIDADLVTLSGCATALGKSFPGEGILGLTRAFHVAGARHVAASLWRVSDRSTAALMADFYRRLRDGAPPAEALRRAQLALLQGREGFADPSYWAPFVLSGR